MRLTHYDEHKKRWQINDDYGAVMIDELNYAVGEAIDKLAAYEDTGLEPDEIKEKVGFMSPVCVGCDGKTADGKRTEKCTYDEDFRKCLERSVHLSELAHAEEQDRLVILPCKVGDTLFINDWSEQCGRDTQFACRVQGISLSSSRNDVILHFGGYPIKNVWGSEIGKTIYRTREEAEAALKKEDKA